MLAIIGILGIYCEGIWPGRFLPGVLGVGALVSGSYFLSRDSPGSIGIALLAAAALLFIAESLWNSYFLSGAFGTVCLALGARLLISKPPGIAAEVAVPASILFGGVTIFLSYAAKQARIRKWSNIEDFR